jgi:hypothetical protein
MNSTEFVMLCTIRANIAKYDGDKFAGKALHSMRDHPAHNTPLLGAAWGARLTESNIRLVHVPY